MHADPLPLDDDDLGLEGVTWARVPVIGEPGEYLTVWSDGSYGRWTPPKRPRHRAEPVETLGPNDTLELELRALEEYMSVSTLPIRVIRPDGEARA